jgi:hypothetical protein
LQSQQVTIFSKKSEGLQTNLQPFTYLYCNSSFFLQY